MKTNKCRCIRLAMIWMTLFLCIYFYNLNDRGESTKGGAVSVDRVEKASGGGRIREQGGAEKEHEDDAVVVEGLVANKDADGSHSNEAPDIELQEDVLPESLEASDAGDIRRGQDEVSDNFENDAMATHNRIVYFRDPRELGLLDKNAEINDKIGRGDILNDTMHTKSELPYKPKKNANGAVARWRVNSENISTNVDFKTLTGIVELTSVVDKTVLQDDATPQGTPKRSRAGVTANSVARIRSKHLPWTISEMGKYSRSLFTPPPNEAPEQRFPKAIIIGAGKCGTRALLEFLRMHPYIVAANSEVHFFDLDVNFRKGLDWYKAQMPLSYSNQMTIEKTPSYLWSQRAVDEIYKLDNKMKLMIIIKDPVTRAMSQATRTKPEHPESMFVEDVAGTLRVVNESRTVDWGVYVKYIKMWLQRFPMSQFYIIESSQFVSNPAAEIQKIERFLGLPPMITEKNFYYNRSKGFYCMRPFHVRTIQCLAPGKGLPHPKLEPKVRDMLYSYYHAHNEELFQLLGRRFDWTSDTRV